MEKQKKVTKKAPAKKTGFKTRKTSASKKNVNKMPESWADLF